MPKKCFLWIHVAKALQVKCKSTILLCLPSQWNDIWKVCACHDMFLVKPRYNKLHHDAVSHVVWQLQMWSVFHTLKSQNTREFYYFFEKKGYDKIFLFCILTNIWWPNVQLEDFLLLFYCEWNTFSRVGPWGPILLKVFQSTCSQLNHSLGSEWNKQTHDATEPTFLRQFS